jgi:hypothetical protein
MVIASLTRSEKNSITLRPREGAPWQWPGNYRATNCRTALVGRHISVVDERGVEVYGPKNDGTYWVEFKTD